MQGVLEMKNVKKLEEAVKKYNQILETAKKIADELKKKEQKK